MKKFVSLFIALVFVLSASASPVKQATKVASKSTTIQTVQPNLPAAAIKHLELLKAGERTVRPVVKKAPKATADEPITIVGNNLAEDMYWGYFPYIYGGNDEYTVEVTFWGETTFGTYKAGDESIEIIIFANDAGEDDEGVWLDFTKAEYKMTEKGLYFYAIGDGEDGNLYEIVLTRYAPEQPKDTLREEFKITKCEGDAYSSDGVYYVYAAGDDYLCIFAIDNMVVKAGEYQGADLLKDHTAVYTINGKDTTYVGGYFTAKVNVREVDNNFIFKLGYFAVDSNYYELTIPVKRYIPEAGTVEHDFGDSKVFKTYYGETQDFYLYVEDEEYIMALDLLGKKLASTFTAENKDFETYYTSVSQIVGKDTTEMDYRNVEVTVSESELLYTITAKFHMKSDNKLHQFTAKYIKPTAKSTETYDIKDSKIQDYRDWYGDFLILAAPADSSVVFQLDFISKELQGTYTEFELGGEYTAVFTSKGAYGVDQANLTITPNNDETAITISGEILANSVLYKVTIYCQVVEETAIHQVSEVQTMTNGKIFRNGQILIVKDGELYNLLGTKVE